VLEIIKKIISTFMEDICSVFFSEIFHNIRSFRKETKYKSKEKPKDKWGVCLTASSVNVEENIEVISEEEYKINVKFNFKLTARNEKETKSGLHSFVAKLCYNRREPFVENAILSKIKLDDLDEFLNIDPLSAKTANILVEFESKIGKRFLPDYYYMYLEYGITREDGRKKLKIQKDKAK